MRTPLRRPWPSCAYYNQELATRPALAILLGLREGVLPSLGRSRDTALGPSSSGQTRPQSKQARGLTDLAAQITPFSLLKAKSSPDPTWLHQQQL